MKRKIGDIFIQIIPVMIGVYLGFVVSNLADFRKRNNQLYTLQNDYNDYGNMMLSGLLNMDLNNTPESMRKVAQFLGITMTDVLIKEQDLLDGYDLIKSVLEVEK
ncbi:hypothetical protein ACFCT7_06735 [Fulvivirgaceae bacterium LMO-SS25]